MTVSTHIPKKSSQPNWLGDEFPAIVPHYIDANKEVFGGKIYVHPASYSKLKVLQDELRERGIDYKHYTYTVIRLYGAWAKKYKRKQVPLSIFCGPKALERYLKLADKKSVEMRPTDDGELLHSEITAATTYIELAVSGEWQPMREVVTSIEQMLSPKWIDLFAEHKRSKLIDKALEILCNQYGVKDAVNYDDLVKQCNRTK